ncbi:MAG: SDR family oxidoreductase [Hyphomicrobiales bacterium]|nr:MAG: SDR family oxidoreductase [Hyphomicrobiales bacterium]
MDLQLRGKRVLVTGGTKGIGGAIVDLFVEEGAEVAFCARDRDAVEAKRTATGAAGRVLDVADAEALSAWVRDVGEGGGIDIVVANVSALASGADDKDWQTSFDVDLMHTVRMMRTAMPYLAASAQACEGAASVIAIASAAAREITFPDNSYGVLKAAITHYMSGLARHLAVQGVRANVVSPGTVYEPGGFWSLVEGRDQEMFAAALALNPRGRMGRPEEIAYAVAMLASPRASWISGTTVLADGALTRGVQF